MKWLDVLIRAARRLVDPRVLEAALGVLTALAVLLAAWQAAGQPEVVPSALRSLLAPLMASPDPM